MGRKDLELLRQIETVRRRRLGQSLRDGRRAATEIADPLRWVRAFPISSMTTLFCGSAALAARSGRPSRRESKQPKTLSSTASSASVWLLSAASFATREAIRSALRGVKAPSDVAPESSDVE